jgi:hypothetical protein
MSLKTMIGFVGDSMKDFNGKPSNTRLNLTIVTVTISLGIAASVIITALKDPTQLAEVLWPAVSALGLAFGGHAVKAFAKPGNPGGDMNSVTK